MSFCSVLFLIGEVFFFCVYLAAQIVITCRQNNDIFLNDQSLRLVGEGSSVASVTVPRGVEHKLALRHENLVHTWTVSIESSKHLPFQLSHSLSLPKNN